MKEREREREAMCTRMCMREPNEREGKKSKKERVDPIQGFC